MVVFKDSVIELNHLLTIVLLSCRHNKKLVVVSVVYKSNTIINSGNSIKVMRIINIHNIICLYFFSLNLVVDKNTLFSSLISKSTFLIYYHTNQSLFR